MTESSGLFCDMLTEKRIALFATVMLCVPRETEDISWDDEKCSMWSKSIANMLEKELDVPKGYYLSYRELCRFVFHSREEFHASISTFSEIVCGTNPENISILIKLYILLISHVLFDARGCVLIGRLRQVFRVCTSDYLAIEHELVVALHDVQASLSRAEANNKQNKYVRYAKIGAAGLGAGALLAVTGGLAAPAIAAGLVVLGTTGAAATAVGLTSVGVMASLFGGAGAGLAGYKMARRTQGVQEFAFEECDGKAKKQYISISLLYCRDNYL